MYTPFATAPAKKPLETVRRGQLASVCIMGGGGMRSLAFGWTSGSCEGQRVRERGREGGREGGRSEGWREQGREERGRDGGAREGGMRQGGRDE